MGAQVEIDGHATTAAAEPVRMTRTVLAPSLVDVTFLVWITLIAIVFPHRLLNSDGDALWTIRFGEWMIQHGAILRVHDFSHTVPAGPFTPMEWLSEVVFAGVYGLSGFPGIVVLTSTVIALAIALSVLFMQRRGVDAALAYALGAITALFTLPHWLSRPHVFTFLAVSILMSLLLPSRGRVRPVYFIPLFALWANLHGGFVFGLGLIGVFLLADAIDWRLTRSQRSVQALRDHALALAFSALACLLNPLGPRLLGRIASHLGDRFVLANTEEFLSPNFHDATGSLLLFGFLGIFTILALRRRRPATICIVSCVVMSALAFQTRRHIPLFGLVVFPLLGLELDHDWQALKSRRLQRLRRVLHSGDSVAFRGRWAVAAVIVLIGIVAAGGRVGGWQVLPDRLDPAVFPVESVAAARRAGISGNLLNDFVWGGYVLIAWPEQKVFIDGATSYYGPVVTKDYITVTQLHPGWREVLQRRGISLVLMPRGSALVAELRRMPQWRVWREDGTAVVLVRARDSHRPLDSQYSPAARR